MYLRLIFFVIAVFCCLVACSDDDDFIQRVEQERLELGSSVEAYGDLLVCSETRDGDSVEVKSEKKFYICKDGEWTPVAEAVSSSSSSSADSYVASSSSLTVIDSAECAQVGRPLTDKNTFVDPRDGQKYRMVTLGGHTWMAQNLNFETEKSRPANTCSKYGRLYHWQDALDSAGKYTRDGKACKSFHDCIAEKSIQGICPPGWHLPTKSEMDSLFMEIGNGIIMGNPFVDGHKGDFYGFSAVPTENYWGKSEYRWWGGESDSSGSYLYCLTHTDNRCEHNGNKHQMPVRCVLDSSLKEPVAPTVKPNGKAKVAACKTMTYDVCEYGTLEDERDGQIYKTVKIHDQWWMAEDLRFNPGDTSASCYLKNDTTCEKIGWQYLWAFAMDAKGAYSDDALGCFHMTMCKPSSRVRGICPEGWRLPNTNDWDRLVSNLGGSSEYGSFSSFDDATPKLDYSFIIGQALARRGQWSSENKPTYDAFGFGAYDNFSENKSLYWTSDENSYIEGFAVGLWYGGFFYVGSTHKLTEIGVRCIKTDED